jgi:hypothetical protein
MMMMMMMMMMMRDVLCKEQNFSLLLDRHEENLSLSLSLSSVFHVFSPPRQQKNFQEEDQKKNLICPQNAKRNLEVPPHKNNSD